MTRVVREVLRHPHPRSTGWRALGPGEEEEAARVTADLLDTVDAFGHCVGLAASQLGELVRIAVVDVSIDHLDGVLFLDRVDSLTADVFRRKRRG